MQLYGKDHIGGIDASIQPPGLTYQPWECAILEAGLLVSVKP